MSKPSFLCFPCASYLFAASLGQSGARARESKGAVCLSLLLVLGQYGEGKYLILQQDLNEEHGK